MTCLDVLQRSAYPILIVWGGLGGNLFVYFVTNREGLSRWNEVQTEVHQINGTEYTRSFSKRGENVLAAGLKRLPRQQ